MSRGDPRLDPPPPPWASWLSRLGAALLRLDGAPGPVDPSRLRRVLVVRTDDRLGNALLTVPLARALARALPHARVDLLLPAGRAAAAEGLPGLRVVRFEKRDAFRRPLRFLRFLRELRAEGYDAAVDAAHWHAFSLTSALIARLAGRRAVVGSARGAQALYSQKVPLPPPGLSEVEAKLLLAGGLGVEPPAAPALETLLGSAQAARARAREDLSALGVSGPFVALNPGARKPDHRWGVENFSALAARLHARRGATSVVLWGPGERALAEAVCAASAGGARLGPRTDLEGLAAVFREAAAVVTNDTGPMHLAVACGAKVVAVGLSADADRWSHPGPRFRLVRAAEPGAVDRAVEAVEGLLALTPPDPQGTLHPPRRDA